MRVNASGALGPRCVLPASRDARLLVEQDSLLPPAGCLIGSVNAARPAARALLAFQQFLGRSFYPSQTCLCLLGVVYPANELVSPERGQACPQFEDLRIQSDCGLKVGACFVDNALRKMIHHGCSRIDPPNASLNRSICRINITEQPGRVGARGKVRNGSLADTAFRPRRRPSRPGVVLSRGGSQGGRAVGGHEDSRPSRSAILVPRTRYSRPVSPEGRCGVLTPASVSDAAPCILGEMPIGLGL